MDSLFVEFLGKPLWSSLGFLTLVLVFLAFDLGVLQRKAHEISVRESLWLSAFYVVIGLLFSLWIAYILNEQAALLYRFALLQTALSLVLIFIGSEMIVAEVLGLEKRPVSSSLCVTMAILSGSIILSLWRTRALTFETLSSAAALQGKE